MKKIIVLFILTLTIKGHSQFTKSMFSKDPIINLENFSVGDDVYLAPGVIVNAITSIQLSLKFRPWFSFDHLIQK